MPAGINLFFGIAAADFPDLSNFAVLNTKVGLVAWYLRSVNDRTAFDNCIKLWHTSPFL